MKNKVVFLIMMGFVSLTTLNSCEKEDDTVYEETVPAPVIEIEEKKPVDLNSTGDDNDVEPKREGGDA
ncbi:hypothetical protein [Maribacter sp.]